MTPEQQTRFDWANQSLNHVKSIVGKHLLRTATIEEDRKQATDLVLRIKNLAVSVRLRDSAKYLRYAEEFTVRISSAGGYPTELDKIIAGNADWMFYGFCTSGNAPVVWYIIDMHVFRQALKDNQAGLITLNYMDRTNTDGSKFRAYKLTSFPKSMIIASSEIEKAAF